MVGYIKGLDGLRAIAILLVVIHHSHFLTQEGYLLSSAEFFGSGVDLFFIVSGYLITNILLKVKGTNGYLKKFYFRRILRIVPLYYLILVIAFFIVPNMHYESFAKLKGQEAWPYWTFLSNYYIAYKGRFENGLIDLSWSLSVEEQFYIFWSICVYFFNSKSLKKVALWILILCPILRLCLYLSKVNLVAIHVMSITRMDTLMMGSLLALVLKDQFISSQKYLNCLMISSGLLVLVLNSPLEFKISLSYTLLAFIFACLLGLVISGNSEQESSKNNVLIRILEFRPLALIGVYSYGIYLFHNPIQKGLRGIFVRFFKDTQMSLVNQQFLFYSLVAAVAFILSAISYNLYEAQWLKLKQKIE